MFGFDANGYYGDLMEMGEGSTATITLKRVARPMFFTSTHVNQFWVGGTMIAESDETNVAVTTDKMNTWARMVIAVNKDRLVSMHVDVRAEYKKLGGNADDLYMY